MAWYKSTEEKRFENVSKDLRGYLFADLIVTDTYFGIFGKERTMKIFKAANLNGSSDSEWRVMGSGYKLDYSSTRDMWEAYKAVNSDPIPE